VQGDCYAGGMGLVAACDIVIAAEPVQFCLSEVRLGLIPATIAPYVIKAMGEKAARRYFLTAERFDAAQALRIGFAHEVVAVEALDAKVAEIVKALVNNSPNAVQQAKVLVREVAGKSQRCAAGRYGRAHRANPRLGPGREGVASFLEAQTAWLL
jgi:methylglutaconyl-CoA hydratase